eukprot:gene12137-14200_t
MLALCVLPPRHRHPTGGVLPPPGKDTINRWDDLRIRQSQRHVAMGDFAGQLQVWDVDRLDVPLIKVANAHQGTINAIDCSVDDQGDVRVASGGRDGKVSVWDSRVMAMAVCSFDHQVAEKKDCWSLCIRGTTLLSGYENGDLIAHDLRTNKIMATINLSASVSSVTCTDKGDLSSILIGTGDSSAHTLSLVDNQFKVTNQIKDQSKLIWSAKYSPFNSNTYAFAGGDGTVALYNSGRQIDRVKLCEYPVLSLDFNKDKEGLLAAVSLNRQLTVLVTPYTEV